MVESLLFIGAGAEAGAGEKITRRRSKANRLRNTGWSAPARGMRRVLGRGGGG